MKKFIRFTIVFIFGFSILMPLTAFESLSNNVSGQVEFNIRFYDRRIYYAENDPILVQVTITNKTPSPFRFKLADERAFSIDFDIRTMTNRPLPEADILTRKRTHNSHIYFREMTIESGESFSFVEDLRDYVTLNQPGSFRVRARMYPELYRTISVSAPFSMLSNYLSLNLRPALIIGPDGIPLAMDIATGAALVKQQLPPDEVVSYMITARQQSQWERFFLYLDLEDMLKRDPLLRRRYQAENEEGRHKMAAEYRQNLMNSTVEGDISVIPTTFEIQRTVYNNTEGTVTVLKKFRNSSYTELRRYYYYLEKKDNFWIIVNYSVDSLGTEAND